MPSMPAKVTVTGLTSTFTLSSVAGSSAFTWYPDPYVRPFAISIGTIVNSTGTQTYNIEHTFDYLGGFSSNFNGFVSSNATWQINSGLNQVSSNASGNYAFPVTGIRVNVTAGSSVGTVSAVFTQAG